MNIKEINAKSIFCKSKIPGVDYAVNPYIGCSHKCIYCYATYMLKFSNHENDIWGDFVDVRVNAPDLVPKNLKRYENKTIVFGTATDPYQPIEAKYRLTRQILEKLKDYNINIGITTKSKLILSDVDLLIKLKNLKVSVSIGLLDEDLRKQLEPGASSINERIDVLKKLHESGIKTVLFMAPFFPIFTDYKQLIDQTMGFVDEYWFEGITIYDRIKINFKEFLANNKQYIKSYYNFYKNKYQNWKMLKQEIQIYCEYKKVKYSIFW